MAAKKTPRKRAPVEARPRAEGDADEQADGDAGADGEREGVDDVGDGDGFGDPDAESELLGTDEDRVVEDEEPDEKIDSKALTRYDALDAYMREVQRHPLLSPEEEHRLAAEYTKSGSVDLAAQLITANLRLVVKIAYEYRRAYRNIMDLVQEGNIGLMQAVKRYDPYRGVKLSSYAAWWIRAYMLRFILNNWRMVKIGTTQAQRRLFFNLSKEKTRLTAMGIEPTSEEIAKRLNVEESEVIEMDRRLSRSDASLDTPVTDGDARAATRLELLPAVTDTPDAVAENAELEGLVKIHLDGFRRTLSGKDVVIFDKRLIADEPLTLQQLGDEFGVSRERVRQLEARITGKLRDHLKKALGDAVGVG